MLDNTHRPSSRILSRSSWDDGSRLARAATVLADDPGHARRLAEYMERGWLVPSAAIATRAADNRTLPVSSIITEPGSGVDGVVAAWNDTVRLAPYGAGAYWGNLPVAAADAAGVAAFLGVADSLLAAAPGGVPGAAFLPVSHPEIIAFLQAPGSARVQRGVLVPNAFMRAVEAGEPVVLRAPGTGGAVSAVPAQAVWDALLLARAGAHSPHILFVDHINNARPEHQKLAGLQVCASSPDGSATLPTGLDHHGRARSAATVRAVLNLRHWMEWHDHVLVVEDVMRFLDNAMQDFIDRASDNLADARYAAMRERSVGLGVAGFHAFLQSQGAAFEGVVAKAWNKRIFRHLRAQADGASRMLAEERGACPDAADYGMAERFSNKLALHTDENAAAQLRTSPGAEPWDRAPVPAAGMTEHGRAVFRTAREVSPAAAIELAADRAPFVCQAEPVRLHLPAGASKDACHSLHMLAWRRRLKSLGPWMAAQAEEAVEDGAGEGLSGSHHVR